VLTAVNVLRAATHVPSSQRRN